MTNSEISRSNNDGAPEGFTATFSNAMGASRVQLHSEDRPNLPATQPMAADWTSSSRDLNSHSSYQVGQDVRPASGSIVATARTSSGLAVSGLSIAGRDIVNVGGIECTVDAAVASGFLVKTRDGYVDTAGGNRIATRTEDQQRREVAQREAEAKANLPVVARLDADSEAIMADFVTNVPRFDSTRAIASLIAGDEVSERTLQNIANATGKSLEATRQNVTIVKEAFEAQAIAISPWAHQAYAHFYKSDPDTMRKAINEQVNEGTTKGYANLVSRYFADLDRIDPKAALAFKPQVPGMTIRKSPNGRIMVHHSGIPGGGIPWSVAYKQGYFIPVKATK